MVSAIIPAWNEEKTIARVVRSLMGHPLLSEIIVVDDGSTDGTGAAARAAGAFVITLPSNRGKASAMDEGVKAARNDIVFFLDGDLSGITHEHVSTIIEPVIKGEKDMFVGVSARRSFWLNKLLHIFPILAGTRSVARRLWESLPEKHKRGFQIEIALNYFAKKASEGMGFTLINGVEQIIKERKHGFFLGFSRRIEMIAHIIVITWRLYVIRETLLALRKLFSKDRALADTRFE